jgi:hypothetical protein
MSSLADERDSRQEDRGEYSGFEPPVDGWLVNVVVHARTEKGICVSGKMKNFTGQPHLIECWLPLKYVYGDAEIGRGNSLMIKNWLAKRLLSQYSK